MLLLCVTAVLFCSCGDEKDDEAAEAEKQMTKYCNMLDAYLEFYEGYIEENADETVYADVMLDADDLPVLVLVSQDDENTILNLYGYEGKEVVFIGEMGNENKYLYESTDGLIYTLNESDRKTYKIEDSQICTIIDGSVFYINGKEMEAPQVDNFYDIYKEEGQEFTRALYTEMYGEELMDECLEWRSVQDLIYGNTFNDPNNNYRDLSYTFYAFKDFYAYNYENNTSDNYTDFQTLISELKEIPEVSQNEFLIAKYNSYLSDICEIFDVRNLIQRDPLWFNDLDINCFGEIMLSEITSLYGEKCLVQLAPVPNSIIEKYVDAAEDTGIAYLTVKSAAQAITREKIAELDEKYADNDDEDAYKRELEELVGWWKSDEYADELDAAMDTYEKNEELGSEDSMLIGYWKSGDELLQICYETVDGKITIEAALTEKTNIPEGKYEFISRYNQNPYTNYELSCYTPDGYESEEYGDMSLSITITINDNDSINIEYTPWYQDSNEEIVYLDTTTETYTRYNPTDE